MNTKENAKTALGEIAQMFGIESEKASESGAKGSGNRLAQEKTAKQAASQATRQAAGQPASSQAGKPIVLKGQPEAVEVPEIKERTTTIIGSDMEIIGDIKAQGNVDLRGSLRGNLETEGEVLISGRLYGDIKGASCVLLSDAQVQGDIVTIGDLSINKNSVVVGNITAKNIILDGRLKGTLQIEEISCIRENAILVGNVNTGRISIADGALITGEMITKKVDSAAFL